MSKKERERVIGQWLDHLKSLGKERERQTKTETESESELFRALVHKVMGEMSSSSSPSSDVNGNKIPAVKVHHRRETDRQRERPREREKDKGDRESVRLSLSSLFSSKTETERGRGREREVWQICDFDHLHASTSKGGAYLSFSPQFLSHARRFGQRQTEREERENESHQQAFQCLSYLSLYLASQPNVAKISLSHPVSLLNNNARLIVQTGSNKGTNGEIYSLQGLTGEGVVVGVADTGIDENHCFFKDSQHGHVPRTALPDDDYDQDMSTGKLTHLLFI
jgi:hypothetical protein